MDRATPRVGLVKEKGLNMADGHISRHLQIKKVAHLLDCSKEHIYHLIRTGQLDAIRVGPRALRISEKTISRFLVKQKVEPCEAEE